jgi:DNA-binding IclR family transcriptional regulator
MRKIRDDVNETVVLSIREGDLRYNIDSVEAVNAIAQAHQIGVAIPLYTGASSRVLLAGMSPDELSAYLDHTALVAYSETTIIDRDSLLEELERVRERGYAVSSGEFTSAGNAVAKAVRGADGRAIAALHVSVPRSRYSGIVEDRCVAALNEAIIAIEGAMRP